MSESAYLIDPISKEYDLVRELEGIHFQRERLVDLDQLYSILGVHNPEVVGTKMSFKFEGLDMAEALTKLQRDGPNKVTPPINLPSWMCCLLPCVKAIRWYVGGALSLAKMQEYDKMVPKTARVIRSGRVMIVDAADLVVGDIVLLFLHFYCRYV